MDNRALRPVFVVVMGVSGAGKSTLATNLGDALHLPVYDGDSLHPQSNIDKMASGHPLNDADRIPWLQTIRLVAEQAVAAQLLDLNKMARSPQTEAAELEPHDTGTSIQPDQRFGVIISCSALKKSYRDILRGIPADGSAQAGISPFELVTCFVFIHGPTALLIDRMMRRQGHFMKADMLNSQLDTLEDPVLSGEDDAVAVSLLGSFDDQVNEAVTGLRKLGIYF